MQPRTLALIALAAGTLAFLADFADGVSSHMRGNASVAGAILIAGAIIALTLQHRQN